MEEDLQVFDTKSLLNRIEQDRELYTVLLAESLTQFTEYVQELQDAVRSANRDEIKRKAHMIKGASLNMCFNRLAAASLGVEESLQKNEELGSAMEDLAREWAVLLPVLSSPPLI